MLVLIAKFGISFGFNVLFISHSSMFPTLFVATAFGCAQFLARFFSALSPLLASIREPLPMIMFTSASAIAAVLVLGLQLENTDEIQKKDAKQNNKVNHV